MSRDQALAAHDLAFSNMEGFNTRARQWAEYSNLKELTSAETEIFNQVDLFIVIFF